MCWQRIGSYQYSCSYKNVGLVSKNELFDVGLVSKISNLNVGLVYNGLIIGGSNMLKRKVEEQLILWKQGKNALLVDGARQVGKSYSIREYAKTAFHNYWEINLRTSPDLIPVLNQAQTASDLLLRLRAFAPHVLEKGELIFIDEIQEAKQCDIITLSKALVEEGSYRYIFSGSLLGVSLHNVASFPVGYLDTIEMFPLDFEEFLWAFQKDETLISNLRGCFLSKQPVDPLIHEQIMKILSLYILVGGMPEAVSSFLESQDLQSAYSVLKTIVNGYKKDISRHVDEMVKDGEKEELAMRLSRVFEQIPEQINSKDKRFKLREISKKRGLVDDIEDDFSWLVLSDIAIPVYNVFEPTSPLRINTNRRLLKLFSSDVGLLSYQLLPTGILKAVLGGEKNVNYGAVYENFAAEEMHSHGFSNLYYYSSKKYGELDFVLESGSGALPIEIKSGKDYQRHVALDNVLEKSEYGIKEAFVFYNGNVKKRGKITYFPLYLLDFLRNEASEEVDTKIDLAPFLSDATDVR